MTDPRNRQPRQLSLLDWGKPRPARRYYGFRRERIDCTIGEDRWLSPYTVIDDPDDGRAIIPDLRAPMFRWHQRWTPVPEIDPDCKLWLQPKTQGRNAA